MHKLRLRRAVAILTGILLAGLCAVVYFSYQRDIQ